MARRDPHDGSGLSGASLRTGFLHALSKETGLSIKVIWAWILAEGRGAGPYNLLNLRPGPAKCAAGKGWSGVPISCTSAGFAQFGSMDNAVKETAWWINHMPHFSGIKASAKKSDAAQLAAIARSPWAEGHYNGGKSLTDLYKGHGDHSLGADIAAIPGNLAQAGKDVAAIPGDIKDAAVGGIEGAIRFVGKMLLIGVILALAAALFYNGIRRLSGDRLPSPTDLAKLGAAGATRGAV